MSQTNKILKYLKSGKRLTGLKALKLFQCWRLASRIAEIKQSHRVNVEMVKTKSGKRIAEYSL